TIITPYGWTDYMEDVQLMAEQLNAFGIKTTYSYPSASTEYTDMYTGEFIIGCLWTWIGITPYTYFEAIMYPPGPNGTVLPVGVYAWADFERWNVNIHYIWEVFNNLSYVPLTDYKTQQKYFTILEKAYLECPPAIPTFVQPEWYEYSTVYWVGWPTPSNPSPVLPPPWDVPQAILIPLMLKPASLATTTTTATATTTTTVMTTTTVVSGTTITTAITSTISSVITTTVSSIVSSVTTVAALPSWVWAVIAVLIIVIIVVAVLALRRR
ncbi:MAG: hypothetical protein TU35_004555, partial [Thermoproteus sp. AZ2]